MPGFRAKAFNLRFSQTTIHTLSLGTAHGTARESARESDSDNWCVMAAEIIDRRIASKGAGLKTVKSESV